MASSHRVHFFHLIWSTKGRQNLILPKMQNQLYRYMSGIITKSNGNAIEIGGTANHVHVLLELSNLDNFTGLIRAVKASSTTWLKQNFPECSQFGWQDGYGSYTVSYSAMEQVRQYIKNQEMHHKTQVFEEEYVKFLNACNVKFDPRFVFDKECHR